MEPLDRTKVARDFVNYDIENLKKISETPERIKLCWDNVSEKFYYPCSYGGKIQSFMQWGQSCLYNVETQFTFVNKRISTEFDKLNGQLTAIEELLKGLLSENALSLNHSEKNDLFRVYEKLLSLKKILNCSFLAMERLGNIYLRTDEKADHVAFFDGQNVSLQIQLQRVNTLIDQCKKFFPVEWEGGESFVDFHQLEIDVEKGDHISDAPDSYSRWMFENLCSGVGHVATASSFTLQLIGDYLRDGDHVWKQQKYRNILQQTVSSLEKKYGPLDQLLATFEKIAEEMRERKKNIDQDSERVKYYQTAEEALIPLRLLLDLWKNPRQQYLNFICAYRTALNSADVKEELVMRQFDIDHNISKEYPALDFLLDLAYTHFADVHLYPFCDYLVHKVIASGKDGQKLIIDLEESGEVDISCRSKKKEVDINGLSPEQFKAIENMDQDLGACRFAVDIGKLRGTANLNFDPHIQSNPPFTLGKFDIVGKGGALKPLTLFRMGSPTREGATALTGIAEIIPEFRAYLLSCRAKGVKHLYISLQSEKKKKIGCEAYRNQAIKDLQGEFPSNFYAVILDQDSDFYLQQGEWAIESLSSKQFLDQLEGQMLNEGERFYFPSQWKNDPQFRQGLMKVMNNTLYCMCGVSNVQLSVEERKDFIELFYPQLALFLAQYGDIDNMNITCKDAIDRAMKTVSLLIKTLNIAQGKTSSPFHQRIHRVYTHAPALLVKKQAIIPERKERLIAADNYLNNLEVQKRIANPQCSNLPIDYSGDFTIEKPLAQRPGEPEFNALKRATLTWFTPEMQGNLLDLEHFDALVDEYINADLFTDRTQRDIDQFFQNHSLLEELNSINANLLKGTLDPIKHVRLKKLITELLCISIFSSGSLAPIAEKYFTPTFFKTLMKQLEESLEEGIKCVEIIDFDTPLTVQQKIFTWSSLCVKSSELRNALKSDSHNISIFNSNYLGEFLSTVAEIPNNPLLKDVFEGVAALRSIGDMVYFGKKAVEYVISLSTGKSEARDDKLRQAEGVLARMEAAIDNLAKGTNSPTVELLKYNNIWRQVMMNLE